jgi:hypothetical protein
VISVERDIKPNNNSFKKKGLYQNAEKSAVRYSPFKSEKKEN